MTASTRSVIKNYDYDAFGNERNIDTNDTNVFRYCGEYFDKETSTIYLRARYYNPSLGRFVTEDSYLGKDIDPLSLNLYTYCWNDPVNRFDPSGHRTEMSAGGGGGMIPSNAYFYPAPVPPPDPELFIWINRLINVLKVIDKFVDIVPDNKSISYVSYTGVEITDPYGKPLGEFDEIDFTNKIFYEDKSARELNTLNPVTNMPFQTADQWATKQIYDKTSVRIQNLQKAVATRATVNGTKDVPKLSDINNIKKFVFRIEADTPEIKSAVNDAMSKLSRQYEGYTFEATYGE